MTRASRTEAASSPPITENMPRSVSSRVRSAIGPPEPAVPCPLSGTPPTVCAEPVPCQGHGLPPVQLDGFVAPLPAVPGG